MKKIINKKTLLLLSLLLFLPVFSGCFLTPSVNQAPTITSTPITTAKVAVAYAYNVNATDPDEDTLTYSLTVNPTGMTIDTTTGVISWTPTSTQSGDHSVTVEVSDGSLSATQSFIIIVSKAAIIHPPTPTVALKLKEITGFTALTAVTLVTDEHLVDLAALKASTKLPIIVTVTDGITPAVAAITDTDWTGTFNGTTGAKILTAVWTMPAGYVDAVDPINVTIIVTVSTAQTTPEEYFAFNNTTGTIIDYYPTGLGEDLPEVLNVVIPSRIDGVAVTSIVSQAFYNKGLTSVTIPDSVTSIGAYAFADNKLTSVTIPSSVTSINAGVFESNKLTSVTIGNSVTIIGVSAFAYNQLTSVTIPSSVTSIGDSAFAHNQLTSITIPDLVTSISNSAFAHNQLTSITIPSGVTSIGYAAFTNNQLTSVTIPSSVKTIDSSAFAYNQLTSITIPSSVTSIGAYAFEYNQLTSITIPSSVTSISDNAFANNNLDTVTIPDSVTSIGNNAFSSNLLTSVIFGVGSKLTDIGNYAFYSNLLTSVIIPNSVTSIGNYAFANCTGLNSVTMLGSSTGIGDNLMDSTANNYFRVAYLAGKAGTYTGTLTGTWTKLSIGGSYQGGIIAYIDGTGHGLIAAIADQNGGATITWSNIINGSVNGTYMTYGTGAANTTKIIAQAEHSSSAAKLCADYTVIVNSVTYDDWFLPSFYELDQLYTNLANTEGKRIANGFAAGDYWSSSESAAISAYAKYFENGLQGGVSKDSINHVRAVRYF